MSFDWADYLKLAEALTRDPSSPGPEEASLRTAISRAYYAAYRSASNLAASHGGEIVLSGLASDHGLVIDHFRYAADPARQKIGGLSRLRSNRNKADYDDVLSGRPAATAQSSVTLARNVLTALGSL
ncbi:hypothetical protein [Candidatus Amarobacter glycogenicus]|uniref:hypothetical protein n=1 Tax=Candidatus Amarobacter glycogenicus TaxID=3140699 RepID=UPI002A10B876|nr:hypothetical protein [Dehalococcoidia bacterium]